MTLFLFLQQRSSCTMLGYDASDLEIMTTLTNISTLLGNSSNMLNRIVPIVRENLVSASQNSGLVTIIRATTKTQVSNNPHTNLPFLVWVSVFIFHILQERECSCTLEVNITNPISLEDLDFGESLSSQDLVLSCLIEQAQRALNMLLHRWNIRLCSN